MCALPLPAPPTDGQRVAARKLLDVLLYLGVRDASYLALDDQAVALAAARSATPSGTPSLEKAEAGADSPATITAALGAVSPAPGVAASPGPRRSVDM